eukprot:gene31022-38341_t
MFKVTNDYSEDLDILIEGKGAGGCDKVIFAGTTNSDSCNCVWGTLDYTFCAYKPAPAAAATAPKVPIGRPTNPPTAPVQNPPKLSSLRSVMNNDFSPLDSGTACKYRQDMDLVCSDLGGLGNCYNGKGYTCNIHVFEVSGQLMADGF